MAKKMGVTMEVGNDGVAVITISNPPVEGEAIVLTDRMVEHGFRPDGVTYGTVLNRLCKYGETSMALDFLRKIKHQEAACCCS
ncbi:BnaA03g01000D [Brassica napus]|uniref:BnaA03g01000D protein n=1 Tax=Brassica napus TaxID=3708 RepID=A0A078FE92_BRANA|nr:BnaA03g01000D [Brassica napus]